MARLRSEPLFREAAGPSRHNGMRMRGGGACRHQTVGVVQRVPSKSSSACNQNQKESCFYVQRHGSPAAGAQCCACSIQAATSTLAASTLRATTSIATSHPTRLLSCCCRCFTRLARRWVALREGLAATAKPQAQHSVHTHFAPSSGVETPAPDQRLMA